jgi:hypothetical protein
MLWDCSAQQLLAADHAGFFTVVTTISTCTVAINIFFIYIRTKQVSQEKIDTGENESTFLHFGWLTDVALRRLSSPNGSSCFCLISDENENYDIILLV